jgi:hypothetical protein
MYGLIPASEFGCVTGLSVAQSGLLLVPSTPDPGASRARHEVANCLVRSFTLFLYTTRACHLLHIARFANGMQSTTVVFFLDSSSAEFCSLRGSHL